MQLKPLKINGAWLATSPVIADSRGYFREWFKNVDVFAVTGFHFEIQQANISSSLGGVVRGIHYSLSPQGQVKWVTCVKGLVKDVIVDIRPDSPTYGQFEIINLSSVEGNAVLIGAGLGHGFVSLNDESIVAYLLSSPYSPIEEFEVNPLDPEIGIDWGFPHEKLLLSSKDRHAPTLAERAAKGTLPLMG